MTGPTSEERAFWEEHGYLEFEQALAGDQLQRLQRAFKQAVTDCKPDWLEGIARGTAQRSAGMRHI